MTLVVLVQSHQTMHGVAVIFVSVARRQNASMQIETSFAVS